MAKEELFTPVDNLARHAELRQRIAVLIFLVGIAFVIIDLIFVSGLIPKSSPYYIGLLLCAVAGFWLNRKQHYTLSSLVMLIGINIITLVFATSSKGVILLFIPNSIGALVLFNRKLPLLRWGFAILSYVLFTICYFVPLNFLTSENLNTDFHSVIFFTCATIAIISLVYIVHFFLDITYKNGQSLQGNAQQLSQLANDLRKSQARFELVIQGSGAGIYEWNVKNNNIYVSEAWKKIMGYSDEDIRNLTIADLSNLMHPDDRDRLQQKIQEHFVTREPFQNESRRLHKNGTYRWIFDSGLSRSDAQGNIEVIVGSIIDITDRKNSELEVLDQNELLKKANKELDRFVYSASHDMRSPLSSILGLISLSELTTDTNELKTYQGMMRERVHKLDSFISEVLSYTRNSKMELVKESVSLATLVNEVVDTLKFADDGLKISITQQVANNLIIETDPSRLKVVLNNLIGNSIKYSDPRKANPFISINSTLDTETCIINIEDNGIGIGPEHQEKVFDMFYRATQSSKGSGLGLYMTKEIVEKLGGNVSVSSVLGKGTRFQVSLPIKISTHR